MGRKLGRRMVETLVVAAGNHEVMHDSAPRVRAKTNPLSQEPSSADPICPLSNHGRTTTGRHYEEDPFSDGHYSRIHCTFLRG